MKKKEEHIKKKNTAANCESRDIKNLSLTDITNIARIAKLPYLKSEL